MKKAAIKAGQIALNLRECAINIGKHIGQSPTGSDNWDNKAYLSMADLSCQSNILHILGKDYRYCGVYTEEHSDQVNQLISYFSHKNCLIKDKYTFIIDPIDGSKNYLNKGSKNANYFGISIALAFGKNIIAGVIYYPAINTLLETRLNFGTYINKQRIIFNPREKISLNSPVRISSTMKHFYDYFPNNQNFGASCYNTLALLRGVIFAYFVKKTMLLDFSCMALAITEAGGFCGDIHSKPIKIADIIREEKGDLILDNFILLTSSIDNHRQLISQIQNKAPFSC